jgi:hypothetical protein
MRVRAMCLGKATLPEVVCVSPALAVTRSSAAEGNYARLKGISTERGGSVGAISSLANIRRTPVASVIFRLLPRGDKAIFGGNSLELANRNAPTFPPARAKLSWSQLAAMPSPIERR